MKTLPTLFKLTILLSIFLLNAQSVTAQNLKTKTSNTQNNSSEQAITADVNCESLGELNGVVTYQYDVTLRNNTTRNLTVDYKVHIKSGNTILKSHSHSDILIPGEELFYVGEGKMSSSEWDKYSSCVVEWTPRN
jgi:hypothetical protein